MSELKSCPFCGGEAVETFAGVSCTECGGTMHGGIQYGGADWDGVIDAWNTRAERTCQREKHGTKMDGSPRLRCSLCGYGIGDKRFNYCPNCGARVEVAE